MLSPAAIVPTPTAANAALRACDRPCCQSMLLTPGDPIGEEGPIGGPYPAAAIGAPPPPPPPPPGAPPPPPRPPRRAPPPRRIQAETPPAKSETPGYQASSSSRTAPAAKESRYSRPSSRSPAHPPHWIPPRRRLRAYLRTSRSCRLRPRCPQACRAPWRPCAAPRSTVWLWP